MEARLENEADTSSAAADERMARRRGYANILHHLGGYYRQFRQPLQQATAASLAPIEAKLTEFVQLGQWSDRNFAALKQSIERSHTQLNRCVGQYRALLDTPSATLLAASNGKHEETAADDAKHVSERRDPDDALAETNAAATLLAMALPAAASAASAPAVAPVPRLLLAMAPSQSASAAEPAPSLHCERLPALSSRMRGFVSDVLLAAATARRSSARQVALRELREAVVERATELRAATDKKARQRKHKAVVDLLRHMREAGLAYHASAHDPRQAHMGDLFAVGAQPSADVRAALGAPLGGGDVAAAPPSESARGAARASSKAAGAVLAGTAGGVWAATQLGERWRAEWSRSGQLYYRCVFRLTQLRHARTAAHADLTAREVQKASGLLEHAFSLLLHQREALAKALDDCVGVQAQLAQLERLAQASSEANSEASLEASSALSDAPLPAAVAAAARDPAPPVGSSRNRVGAKLQTAHRLCGEAVHVAVETCALFDLLAATPHDGAQPGALSKAAAALHRCARALQALSTALPEMPSPSAASAVLVTAAHHDALGAAADASRRAAAELRRSVGALPAGEASHAAPLLSKLDELAAVDAEAEDAVAAADVAAAAPTAASPPVASQPGAATAEAELVRPLVDAVEAATVQLLLAMQGMRQTSLQAPALAADAPTSSDPTKPPKPAEAAEADGEEGGEQMAAEEHVLKQHTWLLKLLGAARGAVVCARLSAVVAALGALGDGAAPSQQPLCVAAAAAAAQLVPAVRLHLAASRWAVHQALGYHGSLVRLQLVLSNLFAELFARGFCTKGPEQEGGEGGGEGKLEDDIEGTGMGEGQGKNDVSDQLQEEGQIEGDSAAKKEEGEAAEADDADGGKDERVNEDEGVEMTNEFEGDMKNLEQPEQQDGGSDEDDDGKDEPEHGMGDLDEEQQEVVDERLWDKEEDDHLQPEGDEKVEKDAPVEAGGDVQMEAKQDEEEDPKKKKRKREEVSGAPSARRCSSARPLTHTARTTHTRRDAPHTRARSHDANPRVPLLSMD